MIEPYSRRIKGPCKIKRYHELIFKMWYDYKHNGEIAQALIEKGCHTDRWAVGKYINRCLEEEGLPHDYSMPWPKKDGERPYSICDKYHDDIAYMRNYLGYSVAEISKEINICGSTIHGYIYRCRGEK